MNKLLRLTRIISGGQTGADQGGLCAARELGIPTGGAAPQGWQTENGEQETLLKSFGLIECAEAGYPARTRQNALDADGTLLVGPHRTGGSALTAQIAQELAKPLFHLAFAQQVVIAPDEEREEFCYWLDRFAIGVLNVAGNRESQSPGIHDFTYTFLVSALRNPSVGLRA